MGAPSGHPVVERLSPGITWTWMEISRCLWRWARAGGGRWLCRERKGQRAWSRAGHRQLSPPPWAPHQPPPLGSFTRPAWPPAGKSFTQRVSRKAIPHLAGFLATDSPPPFCATWPKAKNSSAPGRQAQGPSLEHGQSKATWTWTAALGNTDIMPQLQPSANGAFPTGSQPLPLRLGGSVG